MSKDKKSMDEIVEEIKSKLQAEFGYCGVCSNDDFIMLNSGEGNLVFKVYLKM